MTAGGAAPMRLFAAYVDPGSLAPDRSAVLVGQGMCWPAFFFSVLWALRHRMWRTAAALAAAAFALDLAAWAAGADAAAAAVLWLGFAAYVGLSANDWRGRALERRGMRLAAVIAAPGAGPAAHRLFDARGGPR